MKKLSIAKMFIVLAAVFVMCLSAQAQVPTYGVQSLVGHASCAAATATNLNVVIDCRKQSTVTLNVSSTNTVDGLTGSGAGSYLLFCKRSGDGITYDTTGFTVASPAPNGFTAVNWFTNLTSQGNGYIKIVYLTNAMQASTNIGDFTLSYDVKINAP